MKLSTTGDLLALADVDKLFSKFKSKIEEAFWRDGILVLSACPALEGGVARMDYEPESFNIPGGRYTPDFRAIMDNGLIVFVETKGSRKQRGYRDARSKLRAAAARHGGEAHKCGQDRQSPHHSPGIQH